MKVYYNTNLPFLNNPKDLDPSVKTDLDLWGCFGRKIILSYNQGNTVFLFLNPFLCVKRQEHSKIINDSNKSILRKQTF